ncbi:Predicted metal-dependent hydrolase of the TIM-barrel fold [Delftia tsuruhatensis]|uniref:amidohydrolase family protein n=1 Tax=Delftia tsuruhatensis TaxID=180282 RepID=UPI001E7F0B79|nr:amidohydrolase family protein [Delftia tsuruhatensis]CAB5713120.1 Predicted metal-dependent hydrolase of the TIM-barrel fold [Delftia tsuruhatensis]CAC9691916.1 Predicted metal-dependent hydrolase of the TIM-barrel fold [Delftia tsuruhatensis]
MNQTRKIAFEEHFMAPGFERYSKAFLQFIAPETAEELGRRLADIDSLRLQEMDRAGIALTILSQTGPGVQGEPDRATAIRSAAQNNDYLASRIARHPTRFAGFAALAMQDPKAAATELERAVTQLGFKGALVNGHTQGAYYDDPACDVVWERLQALEVPLYLHPIDFPCIPQTLAGHPEIQGAAWGWGVETASHALRLLFGGVFDRFPGLRIVLGHMGEGLPFQRWRLDSRFAAYPFGVQLQRRPSEYIGSNILITTSGVCSHAALAGAIAEMGAEAVMFSVDYPYESTEVAAAFIESAPLDEATRALVCHGNAERLFKL